MLQRLVGFAITLNGNIVAQPTPCLHLLGVCSLLFVLILFKNFPLKSSIAAHILDSANLKLSLIAF
jgi:hypothetical protein